MTIARDEKGAVIGQVVHDRVPVDVPQTDPPRVSLLTRDGRYVTVPLSSVRLEEV